MGTASFGQMGIRIVRSFVFRLLRMPISHVPDLALLFLRMTIPHVLDFSTRARFGFHFFLRLEFLRAIIKANKKENEDSPSCACFYDIRNLFVCS